jgi:hypothetical protein
MQSRQHIWASASWGLGVGQGKGVCGWGGGSKDEELCTHSEGVGWGLGVVSLSRTQCLTGAMVRRGQLPLLSVAAKGKRARAS